MRILLTNDDGTHAEGLKVLERIARTLSDDVWVVAPERDQSGLSHSLTLSDPLRIRTIDDRHFAINGTPTDCVIMAVKHILPEPPDLVLSGVNSGGNLADDVTYSGTVAGAMEGTMLGIRSVALSQEYIAENNRRDIPWNTVETVAPAILKKLIQAPVPKGVLLNLNFPACAAQDVKDVRVTTQGKMAHEIMIDERADGRGLPYYWMHFSRGRVGEGNDTDVSALRSNCVSVTPLQLDLTAYKTQQIVKDALGNN